MGVKNLTIYLLSIYSAGENNVSSSSSHIWLAGLILITSQNHIFMQVEKSNKIKIKQFQTLPMQVSAWSGRIALETYNSGNRFINFSTSVRCAMAQLTHIQTGKCHFHYFLATLLLQKNRLTPSKLILSQSVGAIFTPSFKALTSSSTSSKSI